MIINKPHLVTKISIWHPRYSDKHGPLETPVVLLSKHKVHHATGVIIVNFTKAKSLKGQRFCVTRNKVERCPVETNGKIECYAVPLSEFEPWETAAEIREIAFNLWED